ncbi:MAG TPA: cytochrome b [Burkholderiales bacterium]|nr:cytochrome b [Burkholderiales bacterium]
MKVLQPQGTARYTTTAIVLHWLIALAVFAQVTLGVWMIGIPKSPPGVRAYWFNVHKSIGLTIGLLVLVRLLWRLAHRPPALPATLAPWQRVAAKLSHWSLYACMIVLPLSGYLGSSFTKYPIKYFGFTLPHWGWDAPGLKELCSQVHFYTVCVFATLIVLHISAALKHRFVDRDGVFERMFPLFVNGNRGPN